MRGTDIVDRSFLHQLHILQDRNLVNHLHRLGVSRVRGDTTQFDKLSIEFQNISIDCQLSETKFMLKGLEGFTLL